MPPLTAEQRARELIDAQLTPAGWSVQDRDRLNLYATGLPKEVRLGSRGCGRHHALLRGSNPQIGDRDSQQRVVEQRGKVSETVQEGVRQVELLEPRCAALRWALPTAAFSGRLTGRSTDTEVVEEIADSQGALW